MLREKGPSVSARGFVRHHPGLFRLMAVSDKTRTVWNVAGACPHRCHTSHFGARMSGVPATINHRAK